MRRAAVIRLALAAGAGLGLNLALFQAFARLRVDPTRVNYPEGKTSNILWNVAESGCGSAPVTIQNTATASLYIYTPYQPNAAALAAFLPELPLVAK